MLRRERVYAVLVYVDLAAAVVLAAFYTFASVWQPTRVALVVMILLAARANLRQARSARLLRRIAGQSRQSGWSFGG
jgi:hypothetical protein